MIEVKKFYVISYIRFKTFAGACIGLILGVIYSIGGLLIDTLVSIDIITSSDTPGLSIGTVYALGALIVMPLIFALIGAVLGIFDLLVYRFYSRWFGQLKVEGHNE